MNVLWFRRGLRFHDNPSLLSAIKDAESFSAIYIFDTKFEGILFDIIWFP